MTSKYILAAVLVVAAATTVSGADPEVAKATMGITHVDFSAVHARIIAQMKLKHFAPHSRGSVVRGRSLIETKLCEYDATESVCEPGFEAMKNFRPATPEGQQLVDMMFKPEIECRALTTMATCVANSKCLFEDNECTSNFEAIMGSPPPSSCKDSEKRPVTLFTVVTDGGFKCGAIADEATCQLAAKDSCEWSASGCNFESSKLISDMMMNTVGPTSIVGTIMKVGMIADECEMKGMMRPPPASGNNATNATGNNATNATNATGATGEATCGADSRCEWQASTSKCDISGNATMSALGVEGTNAMTDLEKKMMTCVRSNSSSCAAPCELDSSNACILGQDELVKSVYGGMDEGPMKTMMMTGFACSMTTNASVATCQSKGDGCTFTLGSSSCDYSPSASMIMELMTAPMPGYEARCPSLMDKSFALMTTCMSNEVSACPATCQVTTEEEGGSPMCMASEDSIFLMMAGEEDGKNMAEVQKTCNQHKGNKASCEAQTMDLDFFGKKNPSKKKVKTTIAFKAGPFTHRCIKSK